MPPHNENNFQRKICILRFAIYYIKWNVLNISSIFEEQKSKFFLVYVTPKIPMDFSKKISQISCLPGFYFYIERRNSKNGPARSAKTEKGIDISSVVLTYVHRQTHFKKKNLGFYV